MWDTLCVRVPRPLHGEQARRLDQHLPYLTPARANALKGARYRTISAIPGIFHSRGSRRLSGRDGQRTALVSPILRGCWVVTAACCYLDFEAMIRPFRSMKAPAYQTIRSNGRCMRRRQDGVLHHREFLADVTATRGAICRNDDRGSRCLEGRSLFLFCLRKDKAK